MKVLEVRCARCGTAHYAGEEHLGKMLKCSKCGDAVSIEHLGYKVPADAIASNGYSKDKVIVVPDVPSCPRHSLKASRPQLAGMAILGAIVFVLGWFYFNSDPRFDFFETAAQKHGHFQEEHNKPLELEAGKYEDAKPASSSSKRDRSNVPLRQSGDVFDQVAPAQTGKIAPPLPPGYTFAGNGANVVAPKKENNSLEGVGDPNPAFANSLPTGTPLGVERYNTGKGKLTISNGTSEDAVVAVVVSGTDRLARKVYIVARSQYTLDSFSEGAYRVLFSSGTDWDAQLNAFVRNASYQEFGKTLFFSEKQLDDGIEYSHHSITLNAVPDGNVPRVDIDAAKFRAVLLQK